MLQVATWIHISWNVRRFGLDVNTGLSAKTLTGFLLAIILPIGAFPACFWKWKGCAYNEENKRKLNCNLSQPISYHIHLIWKNFVLWYSCLYSSTPLCYSTVSTLPKSCGLCNHAGQYQCFLHMNMFVKNYCTYWQYIDMKINTICE